MAEQKQLKQLTAELAAFKNPPALPTFRPFTPDPRENKGSGNGKKGGKKSKKHSKKPKHSLRGAVGGGKQAPASGRCVLRTSLMFVDLRTPRLD